MQVARSTIFEVFSSFLLIAFVDNPVNKERFFDSSRVTFFPVSGTSYMYFSIPDNFIKFDAIFP